MRVDVSDDDDAIASRIIQASANAAAAGADLELALLLPAGERDARAWTSGVAAALSVTDRLPRRIALAREGEPVTTAQTAEIVARRLPELSLLGGSNANFAELNRDPPPPQVPLAGLFYAANPQVHDSDDRSVMQSLSAQRDTVLTARRLPGARPVHVTPVTLLPAKAIRPDRRQRSLFAAAWLVGSAAALTSGGAASVTWFELDGEFGFSDAEGETLFPVHHVMREICGWGRDTVTMICSEPESVVGLGVREQASVAILLANLTCADITVDLGGIHGEVEIGSLDARGHANDAAPLAPSRAVIADGGFSVPLGPYAVASLRYASVG